MNRILISIIFSFAALGLLPDAKGNFGTEVFGASNSPKLSPALKVNPVFQSDLKARFKFNGFVGERIRANLESWLLEVPRANPAILQMFRDRDRKPRKYLVPWAGEFAGKYLISLVQAARMTDDPRLRVHVEKFTNELIGVQDTDGYLGPHPRHERLTGNTDESRWLSALWDEWGHYHCMLGLWMWYKESGSQKALDACLKAADLLCRTFLDTGITVHSAGAEEMNMAINHILCILYEETGDRKYLRLALQIEKEMEIPPAGDYLREALAGKEFYEMPKPRWESLHVIQAMTQLYYITGDEKYRQAYEQIWWSIVEGDRHNTGGFSSGEKATGNPYDQGAIETCCTVAWIALSVDMLRMTGNPIVADEIEFSTLNGNIGGQHPSGRWWTYNTPMDGVKKASVDDINFQCQIGGPELNCCSVNAPRGLGMLSEWAVMTTDGGIVLNYYGPGSFTTHTPSGAPVTLTQTTRYPENGAIKLSVNPPSAEKFLLSLRIPSWSEHTTVSVNGKVVREAAPGTYLELDRTWQKGDIVKIELDMSLHYWVGEKECAGKISVYRGPLLLAFDQRYNTMDTDEIPVLDIRGLKNEKIAFGDWPEPWVLLRFRTQQGKEIVLCDFTSAGSVGTHYRSWLPGRGISGRAFSKASPVWNVR